MKDVVGQDLPSLLSLHHRFPKLSTGADHSDKTSKPARDSSLELKIDGSILESNILRWLPDKFELSMGVSASVPGRDDGYLTSDKKKKCPTEVYQREHTLWFQGVSRCTTDGDQSIVLRIHDSANATDPAPRVEAKCPDPEVGCNAVEWMYYGLKPVWEECTLE